MPTDINKSPIAALYSNLSSVILGKKESLLLAMAALLCRGHLLLEDAPGLGKTTLAKALARSLSLDFKRLQCTPDLLPSDITGVSIFNQESHEFRFVPGPIFTNVLLADEINRTSPRTQSALLEAMSERTVSVDRETRRLADTFMVIATQNPVEFSGTYPLPEAQLDRFFMRIGLGYPTEDDEMRIMVSHNASEPVESLQPVLSEPGLRQLQDRVRQIPISEPVMRYVARIVRATREHDRLRLGASPRGSMALVKAAQALALLTGKTYVTPHLVQQAVVPVLGHRVLLRGGQNHSQEALQQVFDDILNRIPVPELPSAAVA
jgi:MoxR-like ATPase